MTYWEIVHIETRDGFRIELAITPEERGPNWSACWTQGEGWKETEQAINDGTLLWFIARVTASRHGVTLGADYLGGCLYQNVQDFVEGECYEDMVEQAIADANRMIERLEHPQLA